MLTHGLGTRAAAAAAPRPAARDDASGAAYAALDAVGSVVAVAGKLSHHVHILLGTPPEN